MGVEHVEVVVDDLDHPECVIVGVDGLLYAGSESGDVYRIDPATGSCTTIASTGGFILGLATDATGALYICDNGRSEVLRLSRAGELVVYSAGTNDRPMRTPNYAAFDEAGNLYLSDSGDWGRNNGCIYRITPGGATEVWSHDALAFPNGLALSEDARHLYVVESFPPAIARLPITEDGAAGSLQGVIELPGTVPDGLAFDSAGGLYISCYRPDAIYRLDPGGELSVVADDFQGTMLAAPTNVAFDGTTLYVANFARWHVARINVAVAGLPLHHPSMGAT